MKGQRYGHSPTQTTHRRIGYENLDQSPTRALWLFWFGFISKWSQRGFCYTRVLKDFKLWSRILSSVPTPIPRPEMMREVNAARDKECASDNHIPIGGPLHWGHSTIHLPFNKWMLCSWRNNLYWIRWKPRLAPDCFLTNKNFVLWYSVWSLWISERHVRIFKLFKRLDDWI